jgi:MoxR-like ATPase
MSKFGMTVFKEVAPGAVVTETDGLFRAMLNGKQLVSSRKHPEYCVVTLEKALGIKADRRRKPNNEPKAARAPKVPVSVLMPGATVEAAPEMQIVRDKQNNVVYIPDKDATFIPFGEFKDINTIVASRAFFPIFITGPTGNGKSTMVEQSCARNKRTYIRLQINGQTDEDQLIGTKTLVNGNIEIVEGPVLIAMRTGSVLLLDELDAADPNNIMCLQSILEGRPYYFKLKNEMIYPQAGFNIVATGNTKGRGSDSGKYIGTKILNEAFLERFPVTMCQEYPSMQTELRIIRNWMEKFNCVDDKFAQTLVKWSDAIRKTYEDGAIDDLITTRRLIQIVQSFSIFKDKMLAVNLACNRFDSITKATFVDVFEKILPDDTPVVEDEIPVEEAVAV